MKQPYLNCLGPDPPGRGVVTGEGNGEPKGGIVHYRLNTQE